MLNLEAAQTNVPGRVARAGIGRNTNAVLAKQDRIGYDARMPFYGLPWRSLASAEPRGRCFVASDVR
jgi:hypothetical protein